MDIAKISALSSSVKQEMEANDDVKNFVSTSKYFKKLITSLNIFLDPVLKAQTGRKLEQSYKGGYSKQPEGCGTKTLIFAPLNDGIAFEHTWIARLPLLPNVNSVSIYFPSSILQDTIKITQVRRELVLKKDDLYYDYAIPIVLNDFIKYPQHYLCMEKIKNRINS